VGALFVTATGTDVGKSFVAAGILRALRRRGRAVSALKPVMSGFGAADAASSDAGILLAALGQPPDAAAIARISPWRFAAPLSPDMAARREGKAIDFEALLDFSRRAVGEAEDALLIEGVGGIMVPLDDRHTVLDWMAELCAPALLVAGSYLGTISHTLTALDVLRRRGIAVAAVAVSESPASAVGLDETRAAIVRFAGTVDVIGVPRLDAEDTSHPAFERLADLV
jgi:dethiobiotin synthetase